MVAQRVEIPVARRQGEAKSKFVSSQKYVNALLEQNPETGTYATYGAPGLTLFLNTGVSAPVRGVHNFNGVLLAVVGTTLYTVTSTGTATSRGTIAGTLPVIIGNNGTQAVIVADSLSYVWNGTSLAQITDADFQVASSCAFFDQYMIFTKADTGNFFLSELADATAYDSLDIATAESRPDKLVRVFVQNREALLMGTKSLEGWDNVGDADFPLARGATYTDVGIIGKYAVAEVDNSIGWLASDKTVRILRGGTPQIISDPLIAAEIESWTDASLTQVFSFTLRNHQYLVLRNPDGCLIWDASLPAELAWSARQSDGSNTWRVSSCETMIEWGGKIICGDASTGILYELDVDAHDENGSALIMELVSRTMGPGGAPFTLSAIEVEIEPGVSLVTGQGSNAIVWAQFSRDSGRTFGARLERELGATGVNPRRMVWRNLGQFSVHGGVIKLGLSDPVARVITKAWADIEQDAA